MQGSALWGGLVESRMRRNILEKKPRRGGVAKVSGYTKHLREDRIQCAEEVAAPTPDSERVCWAG